MTLHLKGVFSIFTKLNGLNRDIDFSAKSKKKSKKAVFDKTKTSDQRYLES